MSHSQRNTHPHGNHAIDIPDSDPALVVANLVLQARQHRNRVEHQYALSELLIA